MGWNLVLVGRPNGAPSMYSAHSTKSSAFLSSDAEYISEESNGNIIRIRKNERLKYNIRAIDPCFI